MQKSEVIHARVAPDLKKSVEAVLGQVGLSTTDAVTLFFRQIVLHKGLPFEVRIPNAATRRALKDAKEGRGLKVYSSISDFRSAMGGRSGKKPKAKC